MPRRRRARQKGTGIFDSIANAISWLTEKTGAPKNRLLPGEKHGIIKARDGTMQAAQFLGPGTNVTTRIKKGDQGLSPIDRLARAHDVRYSLAKNDNDIKYADSRFYTKLADIERRGLDLPFNINQAKLLKITDYLPFLKSSGGDPNLTPPDRQLLEREIGIMAQEGYGMRDKKYTSILKGRRQESGSEMPDYQSGGGWNISAASAIPVINHNSKNHIIFRANEGTGFPSMNPRLNHFDKTPGYSFGKATRADIAKTWQRRSEEISTHTTSSSGVNMGDPDTGIIDRQANLNRSFDPNHSHSLAKISATDGMRHKSIPLHSQLGFGNQRGGDVQVPNSFNKSLTNATPPTIESPKRIPDYSIETPTPTDYTHYMQGNSSWRLCNDDGVNRAMTVGSLPAWAKKHGMLV